MRYAILALALLFTGCGESEASKKNRALSQVNEMADRLSQRVGQDGYFERETISDIDPWGRPLRLKYHRKGVREYMTITSDGPDKLPFTKDDIGVKYQVESDKVREELSKRRKEAVDSYGQKITHGLTKGVIDAIREGKEKK